MDKMNMEYLNGQEYREMKGNNPMQYTEQSGKY